MHYEGYFRRQSVFFTAGVVTALVEHGAVSDPGWWAYSRFQEEARQAIVRGRDQRVARRFCCAVSRRRFDPQMWLGVGVGGDGDDLI